MSKRYLNGKEVIITSRTKNLVFYHYKDGDEVLTHYNYKDFKKLNPIDIEVVEPEIITK